MSPLRGISLKLTSVFLFIIMASLIKASSDRIPAGEAVFFRSFFAMPVILFWLLMRHDLSTGLRVQNPVGHFLRGVIGVSAMGTSFAALALLPLPEVTAIGYAAPLLTVLFAAVLLGERLRLFRLTAVGIGLVGVLIILWPRLTLDEVNTAAQIGVALILFSSVLRALAQIQIRRLVATEQTSAIVFFFSLTATGLSLITIPFGWVLPTPGEAAMLISAGLIGGLAQIMLTSAYRESEAAVLAPFDYASMLFALLIGYVVFAEVPTRSMLLGAAVVILAGVLIIWRERQLGLKRGKARAGLTPQG
ncbi:DMT family transporter [Puniceibacterium sp. IMCC21224]|uniref:DMT family transporter n=1 Tax=Puniceibacterium sp. IMCC21224 TaxID=1618204 RepID=UPI00064D74DF|nr:DMT family transporter [Puniceibacterium sp. IMCC21224]KMK65825.1 EamA-like transporter family/Multidrug resistance efflux transporter [Puniceibacterium sp. IMCC21224]